MPRIPKATTRHELDRVIIGNQLAIMRGLIRLMGSDYSGELIDRSQDTKEWWRHHFHEDIEVLPPMG